MTNLIASKKTKKLKDCSINSKKIFCNTQKISKSYYELNQDIKKTIFYLKKIGLNENQPFGCFVSTDYLSMLLFLTALKFKLKIMPISEEATPFEIQRYINLVNIKQIYSFNKNNIKKVPSDIAIKVLSKEYLNKNLNKKFKIPKNRTGYLFINTSGSTGEPKCLKISLQKLWLSAKRFSSFHKFLNSKCTFYNFYSFSYLAGLYNCMLIPLSVKGAIFLNSRHAPDFIFNFWKLVNEKKINILWLTPSLLQNLITSNSLNRENTNQNNIKACFIGMAPIRTSLKNLFENKFNIPIIETYGLSETTFLSSERIKRNRKRISRSVGNILPWVKFKIDKLTKEFRVKTPYLFHSKLYFENNSKKEVLQKKNEYFNTGDIVKVFNNNLIFVGRLKNMVKRNGYLVSIDELNNSLNSIKNNSFFIFTGLSIKKTDYICFCYTTRSKSRIDQAKKIIKARYAKFKWPSFSIPINNIPRSTTGKPLFNKLQKDIQKKIKQKSYEKF